MALALPPKALLQLCSCFVFSMDFNISGCGSSMAPIFSDQHYSLQQLSLVHLWISLAPALLFAQCSLWLGSGSVASSWLCLWLWYAPPPFLWLWLWLLHASLCYDSSILDFFKSVLAWIQLDWIPSSWLQLSSLWINFLSLFILVTQQSKGSKYIRMKTIYTQSNVIKICT